LTFFNFFSNLLKNQKNNKTKQNISMNKRRKYPQKKRLPKSKRLVKFQAQHKRNEI